MRLEGCTFSCQVLLDPEPESAGLRRSERQRMRGATSPQGKQVKSRGQSTGEVHNTRDGKAQGNAGHSTCEGIPNRRPQNKGRHRREKAILQGTAQNKEGHSTRDGTEQRNPQYKRGIIRTERHGAFRWNATFRASTFILAGSSYTKMQGRREHRGSSSAPSAQSAPQKGGEQWQKPRSHSPRPEQPPRQPERFRSGSTPYEIAFSHACPSNPS